MGYPRSLSGMDDGQPNLGASVVRPAPKRRQGGALDFLTRKVVTQDGRKVPARAPGTRLFVPGYLDDFAQSALDQQQDGFGVAPLAVAAVAKGAGIHISLKKGSPRVFGGPLESTVRGFQSDIEAGNLQTIRNMDSARKTAKDKSAWQRIWNEMLPSWRYTAQGYQLIKQLDPSFPGPVPQTALLPPGSQVSQPPPQPIGILGPTQPGPATLWPWEKPPAPVPSGGAPVITVNIPGLTPPAAPTTPGPEAAADMPGGELPPQTYQAGAGLAGLGNISPTTLLMASGAILFLLSKKGRR